MEGINLGLGVYGIVAYIAGKGLKHYTELTQEEIKELKYGE